MQARRQFVATHYHGLLGRDAVADPNAAFWSGRRADGVSRGDVAGTIADIDEAKSHLAPTTTQVYVPYAPGTLTHELYETGPGCEVGLPALATVQIAYASLTPAQLAAQVASPLEFTAGHAGQSDAAYVNSLFQTGLGRLADASGAAFWAGLLNSGGASRADVLLGIAITGEAAAHLTYDLSG